MKEVLATNIQFCYDMIIFEKLIVAQSVKKFWAVYRTRRFIIVFTRDATGPYPESEESYQHPDTLKIHFNFVLPSTVRSFKWSVPFKSPD
jgi:hypothetical protein